jgi:hypothetical protein
MIILLFLAAVWNLALAFLLSSAAVLGVKEDASHSAIMSLIMLSIVTWFCSATLFLIAAGN